MIDKNVAREEMFRKPEVKSPTLQSETKRMERESLILTLNLYRSRKTITQIAKHRKMIESTIEAQLLTCVEERIIVEEITG
jgi:Fic family protein